VVNRPGTRDRLTSHDLHVVNQLPATHDDADRRNRSNFNPAARFE
jgi:hypothetical protein